jgi:iron only hydrogenase large subunit-like protein
MSSLLSAEDLNDFIAPGLACVKPVETLPPGGGGGGGGGGEIEVGVGAEPVAAPLAAQILLADCLACLGCVTLAEEVLVAQHSHGQLLRALDERAALGVFVASVLHQLRALLAAAFGRSVREVDAALLDLLQRQMGFRYVVGTGLGRKLALAHEARLVIARAGGGPVLLLVCPGWVLYAEKTHPHVLGHLSTVKLPQQITGCLLKTLAGRDVYHLSVMPCFDKKLESARPEADATAAAAAAPDVDCVLTARELLTLIGELEGKYALRWGGTPDYAAAAPPQWPVELSWASDDGSALGGYALNYLEAQRRHVAAARGLGAADFAVETRGGRNADIVEMRLLCRGEPVASAAVVNGFRNIQNLVRKLKPGAAKISPLAARRRARKTAEGSAAGGADADATRCDYVEIMACPSGCINGGGQVAAPAGVPDRDWVARTTEAYRLIPVAALDRERLALDEWCAHFCRRFGLAEDRLVRTWFKEVQPPTDPAAIMLGTKW